MLEFDPFAYFADLLALCLLVVPAFYLLPWARARRWLLTITGIYLLFSIAPRLALFYIVFWPSVFAAQQLLARIGERRRAGFVLAVVVIAVLAPMVIWKLFATDFNIWFNTFFNDRLFRVSDTLGALDAMRPIIVPIGLSFATFRAVDLLVQSYLGLISPEPFGNVMLYGFFPPVQVIGPIIEYSEVDSQSRTTDRLKLDDFRVAFTQVMVGGIKVFVFAVPIAASAHMFVTYRATPAPTLWVQLFLYAWYFYFNFSGYSDIAIGIARLFGYKLKPNFSRPYTRPNPQEFWNHWHMSLTRWARRNVFIPLGGMRRRTQYVAIAATMMTIALWHNISVALFLFGVYHTCGLIGGRLLNERRPAQVHPSPRLATGKALLLFVFVAVSLPMLSLSVGRLGSFYAALFGVRR